MPRENSVLSTPADLKSTTKGSAPTAPTIPLVRRSLSTIPTRETPKTPESIPQISETSKYSTNATEALPNDEIRKQRKDLCPFTVFYRGNQTTLKIRWSVIGIFIILFGVRRHPSRGFHTEVLKEIDKMILQYDDEVRGLSGYITDCMIKECLIRLIELDAVDNIQLRYNRIMDVLKEDLHKIGLDVYIAESVKLK